MQELTHLISTAWRNDQTYPELLSTIRGGKIGLYSGLPTLPRAALAASLAADLSRPLLYLTATEEEAVHLCDNLRPFLADRVEHFPVLELLPFEVYAYNIELITARIRVLSRLCHGENIVVVASVNAVSRRLPPPAAFSDLHLSLKLGQVIVPADLARRLADMGYERVVLTEIPGTFSMRGSIVDIFPINAERPYRLEFFDDEIDSLRYFDPDGQRSQEAVSTLHLAPGRELPLTEDAWQRAETALAKEYAETYAALHGSSKKELEKRYAPLLDYLQQHLWDSAMEALLCYFYEQPASIFDYLGDGLVLLSEVEQIKAMSISQGEERSSRYFDLLDSGRLLPSFYYNFLSYEQLHQAYCRHSLLLLCELGLQGGDVQPTREWHFWGRGLSSYAQNPNAFVDDLQQFAKDSYRIILSASSDVRLARLQEIVQEHGCPPVHFLKAPFTAGFESKQLRLAVVTERELFSRQSKKRHRRTYSGGEKIQHFMDLRVGDYVVHVRQGIGRYQGVERLTIGDIARDYLLIEYAAADKLYLPVDQLDLIQKYIGNEGAAPKLYRLGGGEWGRVKAKVRAAVKEMAEELLRLYSAREQATGFAFSADTVWQQEFEDAFPYAETPDQLAAAEEIKRDMESSRVMDRLLCGDVGYGKTEIALRAAFKAVMDSKQVAILVPTTVLAQQHYRTMVERFAGYPVSIASLSRFSTAKEQKETLRRLKAGEVDIIVGTHRLLSADVEFHDLGLLVVDEEQRFGVSHKEKIKTMRTQVDALTLSATPIPRTLHMALVGMRDMSIISTPPEARHPVQTYVVEYHERLIRDAISREVGRGGQVYLVNNRVHNIYEVAEEIRQLLPNCRILVGHGQMKERELEQVMLDFVAGEADVLVCTTIIESGLDISNVNTLIVLDADMFGLSQLYQLRGRVGRAQRQAFAYFTYERERIMNETAKKRLVAIRDFTELGSGFKIAMRDLELRGAGNILGPEQHGHIAAVGFDLYCKLLEEEMSRARGEETLSRDFSTQIELNLNAFIPDRFIEDSVLKVEIYKRLALMDSFHQIDSLRLELIDRYGELPQAVENLLQIGKIKVLSRRLQISAITQKPGLIEVRFAEDYPSKGEHFLKLLETWQTRLLFSEKKGFAMLLKLEDIKDDLAGVDLLLQVLCGLEAQLPGPSVVPVLTLNALP